MLFWQGFSGVFESANSKEFGCFMAWVVIAAIPFIAFFCWLYYDIHREEIKNRRMERAKIKRDRETFPRPAPRPRTKSRQEFNYDDPRI